MVSGAWPRWKPTVAYAKVVHDAGNDMLAGVLLHFGETLFIVDRAIHFCVGLKFSIGVVDDQVTFFLDIQHLHAAQNAGVGILAAALREKGGAVQHREPALFVGLAVQHMAGKFKAEGFVFVDTLGRLQTDTLHFKTAGGGKFAGKGRPGQEGGACFFIVPYLRPGFTARGLKTAPLLEEKAGGMLQ